MNRKDLYQSFNHVEDENLERSETGAYRRSRAWIKWISIAACFCLIVSGLIVWGRNEKRVPQVGGPLIPGFYDIYPTVMVNGELYEWETTCNFIPKECVYYGEVKRVTTETPRKNCELAAAIGIEGEIYIYDDIFVYICATTDWLDSKPVQFKRVNDDASLKPITNRDK